MKKVIVAFAVVIGMAGTATAQNKIGYIDTDALMGTMPEAAKAQAELDQIQADLGARYQDLTKQLQKEDSAFVADSSKMSAAMKEIKRNDLTKLYQRWQGWQQESQEIYQAEAQKHIAPIRTKAMEAIKTVAKENGYGYVLDANTMIVAPPGDDLLPLVKKKLGIKDTPATAPAAPARK